MRDPIPITLAAEDELSEVVIRRMLEQSGRSFAAGPCLGRRGKDYLRSIANGLNRAAAQTPYLLLADLDSDECAPALMRDWLERSKHPNLVFRIAVHEIEAWLLAHRESFARFVSVPISRIPGDTDTIEDPKEFLISLVRRSKKPSIRRDIVPRRGSTARVGPDYNGKLCEFVERYWDMYRARDHSESLRRAVDAIEKFLPIWPDRDE